MCDAAQRIGLAWVAGLLLGARLSGAELAASGDPARPEGAQPTRAPLELAAQLFEERNWAAAAREAQRLLSQDPANPQARLIRAVAQVRLDQDPRAALPELEALAACGGSPSVRAPAAYEAGRLCVAAGDWRRGWDWLRQAFLDAPDGALFLKSGCALSLLIARHPELEAGNAALRMQVFTCERLWAGEVRAACSGSGSRPPAGGGVFALPGRAIVGLYRSCIAPAIGSRCSLAPSCSRYFLEASRKHGLLAFPIIADRLIREPGVVAEARKTVVVGHVTKIADPLEDHDAWLPGSRSGGAKEP